MDREAWWVIVSGVTKCWIWLSDSAQRTSRQDPCPQDTYVLVKIDNNQYNYM